MASELVPLTEVQPLVAALKAIAADSENGPEELGEMAQRALDAWASQQVGDSEIPDEALERLAESLRNLEWARSCSPTGPDRDSEEWARMRITALWPDFFREYEQLHSEPQGQGEPEQPKTSCPAEVPDEGAKPGDPHRSSLGGHDALAGQGERPERYDAAKEEWVQVCDPADHIWNVCPACEGRGIANGKGCSQCSKWGIEWFLESEDRCISPTNWPPTEDSEGNPAPPRCQPTDPPSQPDAPSVPDQFEGQGECPETIKCGECPRGVMTLSSGVYKCNVCPAGMSQETFERSRGRCQPQDQEEREGLDALRHPDCRACDERERLSLGQLAQIRRLREALAEDRSKWGFETLMAVGDALLEEVYPEGVQLVSEGEDPGPRLVRAIRDCRSALQDSGSGDET